MPELRKDPIVSRWVIVLDDSLAPEAYGTEGQQEPSSGECPICTAVETPPLLSIPSPLEGDPGWRVAVYKSPLMLLHDGEDLSRKGRGIYDVMSAVGADEVVVESPSHDIRSEDLGTVGSQPSRRMCEISDTVWRVSPSRNSPATRGSSGL